MINLFKAAAAGILLALSGALYAQNTLYVNTKSGLIMRSSADKSSDKKMTIPYGAPVVVEDELIRGETIGGKEGFWREVTYKGERGYAFDAFLSETEPSPKKKDEPKPKPAPKAELKDTRYSNAKAGLIIRTEPTRKSTKIITIPLGEPCQTDMELSYGEETINDITGHWRKVKYKGKTGYAFDGYLVAKFNPEEAQDAADTE